MKKYFVYELRKSLFVILILTLIACGLSLPGKLFSYLLYYNQLNPAHIADNVSTGLLKLNPSTVISLGSALAFITVIWKFSYKMKKRNLDLYYALPLPHMQILLVKLAVGAIAVLIPYTVAYWASAFLDMLFYGRYFAIIYFLPLFFATIIPLLSLYGIYAFLFTRANRMVDGVAFMILTSNLLTICAVTVSLVCSVYYDNFVFFSLVGAFSPSASLTAVQNYFTTMLNNGNATNDLFGALSGATTTASPGMVTVLYTALSCTLPTLAAAGAYTGLILCERRVKAENCEQISNSYFGYKVAIPVWLFCLSFMLALFSTQLPAILLLEIFLFIGAYALSILYKRKVKIGLKFTMILVAVFVAAVVFGAVTGHLVIPKYN